jgi:hypothetical protein
MDDVDVNKHKNNGACTKEDCANKEPSPFPARRYDETPWR